MSKSIDTETIDINIDNYTVMDIFEILNLPDPTIFSVKDKANDIIARMKADGNTKLEEFFEKARDKALKALENTDTYVENQAQDSLDDIWQMNKNGEKNPPQKATVDYYSNISQTVIKGPIQAIGDVASGPPIISRHIINIDSQYRTTILPYIDNPQSASFNTNFTFSLSNPITKSISLRLYSYQIPTSWYSFNYRAGNTFFLYNGIMIVIPDGNYTPQEMVSTINTIALQNVATENLIVSYDSKSRKIKFTNTDNLSDYVTVTFFTQNDTINFNNCGSFILNNFQTLGINTTLGWYLGFHYDKDNVTGNISIQIKPGAENAITGNSPIDVYGPKYFILSLEDYNPRLSAGLYSITNTKGSAAVTITDFYKTIHVDCKTREGSLTRAQQYTINAVKESSTVNNNVSGFSNKLSGPISGSAFALIPLIGISSLRPEPYVKFGTDLAIFKREYVSPTILERFTVRLTDDKGNLVNLNDNDWSFSLIVEEQLN
jgi:hypothetical protein